MIWRALGGVQLIDVRQVITGWGEEIEAIDAYNCVGVSGRSLADVAKALGLHYAVRVTTVGGSRFEHCPGLDVELGGYDANWDETKLWGCIEGSLLHLRSEEDSGSIYEWTYSGRYVAWWRRAEEAT